MCMLGGERDGVGGSEVEANPLPECRKTNPAPLCMIPNKGGTKTRGQRVATSLSWCSKTWKISKLSLSSMLGGIGWAITSIVFSPKLVYFQTVVQFCGVCGVGSCTSD